MRSIFPHAPKQHSELPRHRHAGSLWSNVFQKFQTPAAQRRALLDRSQQHIGGLVKIMARHGVALFGNAKANIGISRLVALLRQPKIGANIACTPESMRVFNGRDESQCGYWADRWSAHQTPGDLRAPGKSLQLIVKLSDLRVNRGQGFEKRRNARPKELIGLHGLMRSLG